MTIKGDHDKDSVEEDHNEDTMKRITMKGNHDE
jgi:hypothetical protein